MSIYEMVNRTKTYIAGDWTGDKDLIDQLHEWNDNKKLGLNFVDVHDLTSSDDGSQNCSIKSSLRTRMTKCKTFVLIVGKNTKTLRSGACYLCANYQRPFMHDPYCSNSPFNTIDNRSFVEYECEMALKDFKAGKIKKIVVIYNGLSVVNKSRCPDVLKDEKDIVHIPSDKLVGGVHYWDYEVIKKAICD